MLDLESDTGCINSNTGERVVSYAIEDTTPEPACKVFAHSRKTIDAWSLSSTRLHIRYSQYSGAEDDVPDYRPASERAEKMYYHT